MAQSSTFKLVDNGELLLETLLDDEREADQIHAVAVLQGHGDVHQTFLRQKLARFLGEEIYLSLPPCGTVDTGTSDIRRRKYQPMLPCGTRTSEEENICHCSAVVHQQKKIFVIASLWYIGRRKYLPLLPCGTGTSEEENICHCSPVVHQKKKVLATAPLWLWYIRRRKYLSLLPSGTGTSEEENISHCSHVAQLGTVNLKSNFR